MDPPVPEQRWLAYCSSIHHFWDTPQHFLKTHFPWKVTFFIPRAPEIHASKFSGVLNTMAKVWKLYHSLLLRYSTAFPEKIFQLRKWLSFIPKAPEIPPEPKQRCLEYQHTKLGRWTFLGQWNPLVTEQKCLAFQYTQHGRWTYFGWWTPQYQSSDALNTSTQKVADEPTLANGPPTHQYQTEMPWITVHNTWQMNLLWAMDPTSTRAEMTCILL